MQAKNWGASLARVDMDVDRDAEGRWRVEQKRSALLPVTAATAADSAIERLTLRTCHPDLSRYPGGGRGQNAQRRDGALRGRAACRPDPKSAARVWTCRRFIGHDVCAHDAHSRGRCNGAPSLGIVSVRQHLVCGANERSAVAPGARARRKFLFGMATRAGGKSTPAGVLRRFRGRLGSQLRD